MAQKSSTAKKASKGSTSKSKSKRKSAPKTKTVKAIKPTLALAESSTPVSSPKPSALRRFLDWPFFAHVYAGISLAVLLSTSSYWALLGARINAGNADQLANTYLFEHVTTFTAALMPDQHSFLLKWPIFLLIRLFGTTSSAFMVATVAMVLVTIAGLAYLLYRIERRALLF